MSLNNQLREVLLGGWPVFFRKIETTLKLSKKIFLHLAHALWIIPSLIIMRALRPFVLIRVGNFHFERIGHFTADVGQRKAESLVRGYPRRLDFWYLPNDHACSNSYWATITRRWFRVHSLVRYPVFWNRIIPFGEAHQMNSHGTLSSRDVDGFLEKAKLTLPSTSVEESAAQSWMAQFGWTQGDPFVCLLVRDSVYLSKFNPEIDWSYHDYRNSDLQNYTKGIEYLISQGIFVFRMGSAMANRANYSHPKFVDYAFREDRSAFLDVWLFANCTFCVSTVSGPDQISDVFRRPLLALNFLAYHHFWSWSNALHYPKFLRWKDSGRLLSLRDCLTHSYLRTSDYLNAGIEIHDMSEQQITNAIKEALEYNLGISKITAKDEVLQKRFREISTSHPDFKKYHGFFHAQSRISLNFLEYAGESFLKDPD